jgi:hypothetical protein
MALALKPQVQRTYSDPDLPQLLQLPVRPSSSYEPRPKAKEYPSFDPIVVEAMARKLGLEDLDEQSEFQWVVRDCLLSLRDENWACRVVDGGPGAEPDLEYVYKYGNEDSRSFHHVVEAHRRLAESLRHVTMDLKMKRLNPHYRVKHLVYLAIMGCAPPDKDVRGVTYPQLIEEVMENLDVKPQDEPYLIHRIKVTIEDSYFRMKKQGPHLITIDNAIDVDSLCVNLELDRVGFMKKVSPTGLLYCVECQTALADVASTSCHDVFCNKCAVETHSTGHRQDSQMVFIEQTVCSECECKDAVVRCQDCVDLFCKECFAKTHARGKRKRHCVGLPQRTFCFECDEREASYICIQTEEVLCTRCSAKMHRSGARQNHTLFGLRKAAYNKRLFADNMDQLHAVLQKHVQRSYSLSPWFIFYDTADPPAPYWYNFITRTWKHAQPHDLVNPPLDDLSKEYREMCTLENCPEHNERLAALSADDQLLRGLPGSTNLQGTHAAHFASQSACFDVPPPIHVKFHSPLH